MGIFDRMTTLAKANINELIDRAEDPEVIAKQVIHDLEDALRQGSMGLAASIAEEKKLKTLMDQAAAESELWYNRAADALERGDETIAKEALKRKLGYDQDLSRYVIQHEAQETQVKMLRENLSLLESNVDEAKRRRDALIARNKTAEAQKKIAETLSKASKMNPLEALDRMEQKVNLTEAQAEAYGELRHDSLEQHFNALDKEKSVDEALEELKNKLAHK